MTWLKPIDDESVVYEFFAPFAHVPGKYEWCRIRSPTHGVFDTFILLGESPVAVYVSSDAGERFMRERYPECRTFRVPADALRITELDEGRTVEGRLFGEGRGPVMEAFMRLGAPPDGIPEAVPYGGEGEPVWGSKRFTCWGVDLVLRASCTGRVDWADGRREDVRDESAVVTLGSFGRISPLAR